MYMEKYQYNKRYNNITEYILKISRKDIDCLKYNNKDFIYSDFPSVAQI